MITTAQSIATVRKPVRTERDMGLPPPFEELIHQNEVKMGDSPGHLSENCGNHESLNDYALPDEHALLHVTNRRKVPLKRRNSLAVCFPVVVFCCIFRHLNVYLAKQENSDVIDMQAEYEDLLLKFETQVDFPCLTDCMLLLHIFAPFDSVITILQGITKDIQIECLAKKLAEAACNPERTASTSTCHLSECVTHGGKALTSRESEAILVIKQLQDQVIIISMCCLCLLSSDTYGYVNF